MAREGLRYELISTFQRALHLKSTAISRGVKLESDGHTHFIDLTVQHIAQPEGLAGTLLVIFEPVETPAAISTVPVLKSGNTRAARIAELELELKKVRDELHITHEEMQTSQEELQSTNEELQSVNEELQSTNEELTTSKEELQSLNEELQTVNSELQSKVDDLSQANNDLKNLLNSTDVATVFLDGFFNVRRFTTQSTQVINLIPSDVGRPYTDITSALVYPEIIDDAREVLRSLVSIEKEISTRDQRWFGIRIMPYRTQDNRIDGVVMTFSDITTAKILEMELRARAQKAELLMDAMPVGLAVIDNQDKIARLNPAMEAILGVPQERLLMESESRLWKLLRPNGARLPVEELPGWRILHGQPAAPWIEVEATRADARAAHVQAGVVPYQQPEGGALLIVIELPALANASRGSNPT
jgi:two-component system, chemotaxis family, CheB/CheR fusion protein